MVAVHTAWSSPVDVVEGLMVGYVVSRQPTEGGSVRARSQVAQVVIISETVDSMKSYDDT